MIRAVRIGSGVGLVLTGTALLVLPGPGLVTIAAGLAVLSKDYRWAGETLDWMKVRYRKYLTKDGRSVVPGEEPTGEL
jgi:Putative transmembrane protein (PGPGW)